MAEVDDDALTGDPLGQPGQQPLARPPHPRDVDVRPGAGAHDHVSRLEFLEQRGDLPGRVRVVGIEDHAGVVLRGGDPGLDGGAVATIHILPEHARAGGERLLARAVRGPVVDDEDLVSRAAVPEGAADRADLPPHRPPLVQGGQDHAHGTHDGARRDHPTTRSRARRTHLGSADIDRLIRAFPPGESVWPQGFARSRRSAATRSTSSALWSLPAIGCTAALRTPRLSTSA